MIPHYSIFKMNESDQVYSKSSIDVDERSIIHFTFLGLTEKTLLCVSWTYEVTHLM